MKTIEYDPTNRYSKFDVLKEMTQLMEVGDCQYHSRNEFHKMIQLGELNFFDYGRGFINLEISPCLNMTGPKDDNGKYYEYVVRMWFANIDDGDFGGWGAKSMSYDKCYEECRRIAEEVFSEMVTFPTADKLNELLRPYGIFVGYE